ncbi:YbjN domain-containing protein [Aureimonas sp. SK2]|uniref:YbjN domain-containing protein n=1 Tax=Aureimonas sp. SK2 TaxID=3015992 RepID=UPI0024445853|nr:YbjN domain-containing protein [Aureimonas sp. SK2]
MQLNEFDVGRSCHPVDVIETVASHHDWSFERPCDDEIAVSVRGAWTDYSVSFSWMEPSEALHLGCAFMLKVPARRQVETMRLLSRINEQLLVGHFDLWPDEGAVMFRHAMLLPGGVQPTSQQAERLLSAALEACERYYQAFQFVVWADKGAEEALACAVFDTVGNA